MMLENHREAVTMFTIAMDHAPQDARIWLLRAKAHASLGKFVLAEVCLPSIPAAASPRWLLLCPTTLLPATPLPAGPTAVFFLCTRRTPTTLT